MVVAAEPEWARQYRARFQTPYGFDALSWESVMRDDLPEWTADRLIHTMQWMQSRGQKWPKSPRARDLIMAMRTRAKGERVQAEPTRIDCAVCRGSGTAIVWTKVRRGQMTIDAFFNQAAQTTCPCACTAGERSINTNAWRGAGYEIRERWAGVAVRQHGEIVEMWRNALPADMEGDAEQLAHVVAQAKGV